MRRLSSLPPLIGAPSRRVAPAPPTQGGSGFSRADGKTRQQRGYGADWQALRRQILSAEPLCRTCAEAGRVTPATEVHHIESFLGLDDPLRLDPTNCAPICKPCHLRESQRQAVTAR